ncbi:hypothetical protein [Micromonospora sp. NPDC005206]|uniref:hypothetical protein n=1 Tax=Micromonospora sp. NPDC005206 TaxID=3157022 RepID=UPI0033BE5200
MQDTIDQPRALFSLDLSAAKVTSWRNPLDYEDLSSMWARRYYNDGSKLAHAVATRSDGGARRSGEGGSGAGWYQPAPATPVNNQ